MYYDKRIRYLSYYESGIKLQNAGYVKFQVRDSLCQMIIYMKGPRLMGSGEAKVYLLSENQEKREEDSFYAGGRKRNLKKHILGNLNIRNGQGYCSVRLDAENMAGSGLRYDQICGIKIELHEYQYLESQWIVTNFMPARQLTPGKAKADIKARGAGTGGSRTDVGLNGNMTDVPVEVNLIVTPVSENLRVEKVVKEEPVENIVEEEKAKEGGARKTQEGIEIENISVDMFRDGDGAEPVDEMTVIQEMTTGGETLPLTGKPASGGKVGGEAPLAEGPQIPPSGGTPSPADGLRGERKAAGEISPTERLQILPSGETPLSADGLGGERRPAEEAPPEGMMSGNSGMDRTGQTSDREESMQEMLEREIRREEEKEAAGETENLHGAEEEAGDLEVEEEVRLAEQELQPDKWQQLRKTFPIIHPIREEEEYLKITPRDFVIFTEKYQELVHNSFLLHGYYNYKHLILGKKEKEGRTVYYLGVPGTFHEREKTVAIMFGFEAFDGKREPAENGDFGYYLRRVEI